MPKVLRVRFKYLHNQSQSADLSAELALTAQIFETVKFTLYNARGEFEEEGYNNRQLM